jgi:starvation-inducible outer membrane lipoprotein
LARFARLLNILLYYYFFTGNKFVGLYLKGYLWATVDESTDRNGRCMANLIVGVLDPNRWHRPHLIAVKPLVDAEGNPKVDGETVGRFVNSSLGFFNTIIYYKNVFIEEFIGTKK